MAAEYNTLLRAKLEKVLAVGIDDGDTLGLLDGYLQEGRIEEKAAEAVLKDVSGAPYLNPVRISFSGKLIEAAESLLGKSFCMEKCVIPVRRDVALVKVVVGNPLDAALRRELEVRLGSPVQIHCSLPTFIRQAVEINFKYPPSYDTESLDECVAYAESEIMEIVSHDNIQEVSNLPSVINILRLVFAEVANAGISDVHFEPQQTGLVVRVRQDGVLRKLYELGPALLGPVLNRLKLLAGMDVSHTNKPQDGRIGHTMIVDREMDIRVSVLPSVYGEKAVLRLLDKGADRASLASLEIEGYTKQVIDAVIRRPNGLFLVTGPTGSGKTTTLYAILDALNTEGVNISTAEDPVEYELSGITQTDCSEQTGLAFSDVLRSMLRQDPDIILVGEIRDYETADIAVKAALTGHLILSALHTNSAAGAILRLINLGIPGYLIAACSPTVVAQRLIRRICEDCKQSHVIAEEDRLRLRLSEPVTVFSGAGCLSCGGTGYKGRTAVMEALTLDAKMIALISSAQPSTKEIEDHAVAGGMITMRNSALEKMLKGVTTPQEVLRVTVESSGDGN